MGGTSLKILAGIAQQLPANDTFESHCHGLRQKVVPVFPDRLWKLHYTLWEDGQGRHGMLGYR